MKIKGFIHNYHRIINAGTDRSMVRHLIDRVRIKSATIIPDDNVMQSFRLANDWEINGQRETDGQNDE
ncbi:MAG: hypothetical protein ACR2PF_03480 [Rhizobiaceae bacterium]